jgi:F0F1-type ATP synthase assembly protein I
LERQPSEQDDSSDSVRRRGKAYQSVMEAVFAIPIGGGIGWFLGGRLGSETIGLLVGLGFGFATFIIRLTRMRGMVEREAAEAERRKELDE